MKNLAERKWNASVFLCVLIAVSLFWEFQRLFNHPDTEIIDSWVHIVQLIMLGGVLAKIRFRGHPWYWVLAAGLLWLWFISALRSAKVLSQSEKYLLKAVFLWLLLPAVPLLLERAQLKKFLKVITAGWTIFYTGMTLAAIYIVSHGLVVYDFSSKYFIGLDGSWSLRIWDTSTNCTAAHMVVSMMLALIGMALSEKKIAKVLYGLSMLPMFVCMSMTISRAGVFTVCFGFGAAAAVMLQAFFSRKIRTGFLRIGASVGTAAAVMMAGVLVFQLFQPVLNTMLNPPAATSGLILSSARAEEEAPEAEATELPAGETEMPAETPTEAPTEAPTEEPEEQLTVLDGHNTRIRDREFMGSSSLTGRDIIWRAALDALGKKPELLLTGTTIPMLKKDLVKYGDFPESVSHLHNIYLQILGEAGIPGLLLCVFYLFFVIRAVFRLFREAERPLWERFLILPVVCVLLFEMVESVSRLTSRAYINEIMMLFSAAAITLASKPGKGMERKGS